MNEIRNSIKKNFSTIPNQLIEDERLKPLSRFLFIYMASKSDDWTFFHTHLQKAMQMNDPRTFRKHVNELLQTGWLSRERTRKGGARFDSFNYTLHSEPQCKICTVQNLHSAKNALLTNKELITKEKLITNTLSKNENQENDLLLNAPDSEKLFFRALEKVTAHLQMYPDTVQLMRDSAKVTESDFPAEKITDEVKEWIRWNCEDVMFVQEAAKRLQYGKSTFVSWLRIAKEKAAKKSNGYASAKPNNRNSETPDERNQRVASGAIELHNELLIKHGIKPGDYSGGH